MESNKYMEQRDERIRTQLAHMNSKHLMERDVLVKKVETALREQDKGRKKD